MIFFTTNLFIVAPTTTFCCRSICQFISTSYPGSFICSLGLSSFILPRSLEITSKPKNMYISIFQAWLSLQFLYTCSCTTCNVKDVCTLLNKIEQRVGGLGGGGGRARALRYVYTLRLIGPISYLGACYIRIRR